MPDKLPGALQESITVSCQPVLGGPMDKTPIVAAMALATEKKIMRCLYHKTMLVLLLMVPFMACGQGPEPETQTSVKWRELATGGLSGFSDASQPGQAGAFVGVHNGALILAGGASRSGDGHAEWSYSDRVWAAMPDSDKIAWREADAKLPGGRAFGATASHTLGLLAIGGTDGHSAASDFSLIRWNPHTSDAELYRLPPAPNTIVNGNAAVIDDRLYVAAESESEIRLLGFDLSRLQTDDTGAPVADGNKAIIADKVDAQGTVVDSWQRLPSLPRRAASGATNRRIALAAQKDGHGARLFVVDARGEALELWAFDPGAQEKSAAWTKKASPGKQTRLDGGILAPLGQSHLLMLTGPDDQGVHEALSYNTITDAWAKYESSPRPSDNLEGRVTTDGVRWTDGILLVSGSTDTTSESPRFRMIDIQGPAPSFGGVNMAVLIVYLLSMVMVGVYFIFKNTDTNDYFRGGQSIPWWAAACSIYATMLSSLTYVALPALVYRTDWLIYIGTCMILVVAPIAIYVAMPFFRQIDATSAYEYLSRRFNMPVRLFASGLFTLFHIGRMGIVLALTALALAAVTPLDPWQSVLVMGVLSLIYCTLGGVEAVIWTDTIQTVVLMVGAVLCFTIIIGGIDGGLAGFISTGMADDKFRMVNLDFGPESVMTLSIWVIVLGGLGQHLSSYSADQAVVQRYMTTENTEAAAKSIWMNGIMVVPGALLFFCIGTGLYAFYKSQPEKLDPNIRIDQIFPTFIGAELPVGIAGLIVAGIFAAAQSTVSTSMNSIATTAVTDFMRPLNACRSEHGYLNAARILTFMMGVIGTLAGLLFISPEVRSLMEEYFKVIGMFMGALGGLFVLGVASRRANGWGALVGIFSGVAVMVAVWLNEWADGYLFATVGIVTALLVGYLASFILPSDRQDLDGLTLYTMKRKPKDGSQL